MPELTVWGYSRPGPPIWQWFISYPDPDADAKRRSGPVANIMVVSFRLYCTTTSHTSSTKLLCTFCALHMVRLKQYQLQTII